MTDQSSIRSILASLQAGDDENVAFLIAAAFNLYHEAIRKVQGRILLGPTDIRNVLSICSILLSEQPPAEKASAAGRARELSEEEKAQLLAVEEGMRRL
jgi:hypothetical protein